MKKAPKYFLFALILLISCFSTSCGSNKTGCPINETAHVKTDRKGNLPSKRGKTSLFPKQKKSKKKRKN